MEVMGLIPALDFDFSVVLSPVEAIGIRQFCAC